jgi:predicted NAD-dependent protein-ADP-ribosyltransferase YbiA (DUF1768 family)
MRSKNTGENMKDILNKDVISTKFNILELANMLVETGDGILIEGNYWGD